jgi:IS5 family transposase
VTGQRIHGIAATLRMRSAQGRDQAWAVVRRITGALADLDGKVAADAEKVLVDARRALRRAVNNLTPLLDTTRRRAFRPTVKWRAWCERRINTHQQGYGWDRTRIERPEGARTWTGHGVLTHDPVKIAAPTENPRIKDQ